MSLFKFRKILNNIISLDVIKTLGIKIYLKYLKLILKNIIQIKKDKTLKSVDQSISKYAKLFYYKSKKINFNCNYIDSLIKEDSYSFGLIREIIIRDCYFKHMPEYIYKKSKFVMDIGSNRGCFSALMSQVSEFILSVESHSKYNEAIKYVLKSNNFKNHIHVNCFVGGSIKQKYFNKSKKPIFHDIEYFFENYGIDFFDLVKIDIEGSEFLLFNQNLNWLEKIGALTMEVHPDHGNPILLINALKKYGFIYKIANQNLSLTNKLNEANFIYAWKKKEIFAQ